MLIYGSLKVNIIIVNTVYLLDVFPSREPRDVGRGGRVRNVYEQIDSKRELAAEGESDQPIGDPS